MVPRRREKSVSALDLQVPTAQSDQEVVYCSTKSSEFLIEDVVLIQKLAGSKDVHKAHAEAGREEQACTGETGRIFCPRRHPKSFGNYPQT